ncbi:hypothetical protein NBO_555g0005 [Nosema bombycis CQ1]|uniref:Uncharacterized protein n=1 Tax=Nosema bombycis (strain CQ1 / CVCC 102059) TaxID=578461 RepID=R0MH14_NOSB1|nr:hypothetical protein NBO_555g0005 [Nosema bombycis CQ1]|eukprot:EOB12083.1 hypothetical protein NBO_555g0005 [Nosema bombycis CQ1]
MAMRCQFTIIETSIFVTSVSDVRQHQQIIDKEILRQKRLGQKYYVRQDDGRFLQEIIVFCSSAYEKGGFLYNFTGVFGKEQLIHYINTVCSDT